MIKFIYGNPGTGKTQYIYTEVLKDAQENKKAILIVPEQFTVASERDVIKLIPPSAQLNIEVLNFTRLANRLFREHGGISYNFVTKAHEKLIMWQAIKMATPFLREYKILSSDDYSLADAMLATYKELTASGISMEQIDMVSESSDNSILSSKIKDIATIGSIYDSMLGERFTDTNKELSRLHSLLRNQTCLNNINVYIDGFTSFTGLEHNIIKEIMRQADNMQITIGIPEPTYKGIDTLSIKECSDHLRRDVASLGVKSETILLKENYRSKSNSLNTISTNLWQMQISGFVDSNSSLDCVELYKASDIYDECEFASAKIRELVENGYRYGDIAIIARNIDKYRGIIEPALDNMGAKYFISEKSDLSNSPIAKLILSAIRVFTHGWRRSDIISHLKTGLCGISSRESDLFECYTAKWNISGKKFLTQDPWNMNPDGYTTNITERGHLILETANKVREKLIGNLKTYASELKASETYKDMCVATMNYLDSLNVRESMLSLSKQYLESGNLRAASDCARMFEISLDALDCVCEAVQESNQPDINTFGVALSIAFSESELGSIPTSQDEITLGSANILRTDNIKCAMILGACDSEFPATAKDAGLFNAQDRQFLIEQGVQISYNPKSAASDELYYFRRAASAPSEKLIVFTRSDSEPSIAFTRITNIFPDIRVKDTSSLLIERLRTLKAVTEYEPLLEDTNEGVALHKLVSEFDPSREGKFLVPVTAEKDRIEADTASMAFGNEVALTQSKTDMFANCKFAYSCKYLLYLDEGKKAEFSFSNIGTFIHHILEKFLFRVYVTNKGVLPHYDEIRVIVDDIIEKYIFDLLPDKNSKNARLMHLIDRLKRTSLSIISELLNELTDSSFKPEFFELRIGSREIPSVKVTLNNGSVITVSGIVDRVDVFRNGDNAYLRVVDYKTGSKTFSVSDIKEGFNLQMLLYIFSLTQGNVAKLENIFGGTPVAAGVTYLSIDSSKCKTDRLFDKENDVLPPVDLKRTGLILDDEDVINALSNSGNTRILMKTPKKSSFITRESFTMLYNDVCNVLSIIGDEMLSGNINAIPKNTKESCKYCSYASVCKVSRKGNG